MFGGPGQHFESGKYLYAADQSDANVADLAHHGFNLSKIGPMYHFGLRDFDGSTGNQNWVISEDGKLFILADGKRIEFKVFSLFTAGESVKMYGYTDEKACDIF